MLSSGDQVDNPTRKVSVATIEHYFTSVWLVYREMMVFSNDPTIASDILEPSKLCHVS